MTMIAPSTWTSVFTSSGETATTSKVTKHPSEKLPSGVLTFPDIFALGIIMPICGIYYGWNAVAFGYICCMLCVSEMSSFFPFGGGSFGYCRCIIHPYIGFLVGVCELVEYALFTSTCAMSLAALMTLCFSTPHWVEPYWWGLFYAVSLGIQFSGPRVFFNICKCLALLSVLVLLMFFFVGLPSANLQEWADYHSEDDYTAHHTAHTVMRDFGAPSWMLTAVEGTVLASEGAACASRDVPRAVISAQIAMVVLSLMVIFTCISHSPGSTAMAGQFAVLNPLFEHVFQVGDDIATLLYFPACFGTPFAFQYCTGKLLGSMSQSRVFPARLGVPLLKNSDVPHLSLFLTASFSFCWSYVFYNATPRWNAVIFTVLIMMICFVYLCLAWSYWICVERYSNLERPFVSPLGKAGAVLTALIFGFMFIGQAFYQASYVALYVFLVFIAVCSIYYWAYARQYEYFSDAEVNTFMKAYVINANIRRKQAIKKRCSSKKSGKSSNSSNKPKTLPSKNPIEQIVKSISRHVHPEPEKPDVEEENDCSEPATKNMDGEHTPLCAVRGVSVISESASIVRNVIFTNDVFSSGFVPIAQSDKLETKLQ